MKGRGWRTHEGNGWEVLEVVRVPELSDLMTLPA